MVEVDGLYIGPGDLSVDLGHPGRWDAPPVLDAIAAVAAAAQAHGKLLGCHYDLPEQLPRLAQLGVRMYGHLCDIGLFKQAAAAAARAFRDAIP